MDDKVLVTYPRRCSGCRICEQWCAYTHLGRVDPVRSRVKVIRSHEDYSNIPVACHQCPDSPCVASCKFGALDKNPETGAIMVDEEKCVGCRRCMGACPHSAICMDKEKKVVLICDLCGGHPRCVAHCPAGALEYLPLELTDRGLREEYMQQYVAGRKEGKRNG